MCASPHPIYEVLQIYPSLHSCYASTLLTGPHLFWLVVSVCELVPLLMGLLWSNKSWQTSIVEQSCLPTSWWSESRKGKSQEYHILLVHPPWLNSFIQAYLLILQSRTHPWINQLMRLLPHDPIIYLLITLLTGSQAPKCAFGTLHIQTIILTVTGI